MSKRSLCGTDKKIMDKKVINYREANKRCDYCKYYDNAYLCNCRAKRKTILFRQQARICKLFTLDDEL